MTDISENFRDIKTKISKAARDAGRDSQSVCLVAVTKTQSPENIDAALATGHRIFGENRVQEAKDHWAARRSIYPDLKLHLIGPLQTNKVRDAVVLFDVIETVDRESLVDALAAEETKQDRKLTHFIQVNTGAEEQKAGVSIENFPSLLDYCRKAGLEISGLMCIPPVDDASGLHFALLKKLAERHGLRELSMGMSSDYPRAIMAGATYVRVGTALFGKR